MRGNYVKHLGSALHDAFDGLADEPLPTHWIALLDGLDASDHPLPERWVDLINRLNVIESLRCRASLAEHEPAAAQKRLTS
jgi:hypothetical protein